MQHEHDQSEFQAWRPGWKIRSEADLAAAAAVLAGEMPRRHPSGSGAAAWALRKARRNGWEVPGK